MSNKAPSTHPTQQYLYGDKRTWEIVLDAVQSFSRPVSAAEIGKRIATPDFARGNINADLSLLSVNSYARGNYTGNRKPRRCDSGNDHDRLIKIGRGPGVLYAMYDPQVHGIWELVDVHDKVLRPRFVGTPDSEELARARDAADTRGLFDPDEDARKRTFAAIVQREGQPAFRRALLKAYDRRCAISGCAVETLLEAAHIVPYRGARTNDVGNGLLLRVDLHKLLDLHQISIDPSTRTVRLTYELQQSEYACFAGVRLRDPVKPSLAPLAKALEHHQERCGWLNASSNGAPLDAADEKEPS